mgnify:CR=1 FL=1
MTFNHTFFSNSSTTSLVLFITENEMYQCFNCGFQSKAKDTFIGTTGDGRNHWILMICPQCSLVNPPVAEIGYGSHAPWKQPTWAIEETNDGIYVKVTAAQAICSCPMIRDHQLWNVMYKNGMTYGQYHAFLVARGNERKAAFKAKVDVFLAEKTAGRISVDTYLARMDEARKECLVGPYDTRIETRPPMTPVF